MNATVSELPPNQGFAIALLVAALLHATLILGLGFNFKLPTPGARGEPTLEVVLVNRGAKAEKPVEKPDFLAQANIEGTGDKPDVETAPSQSEALPPEESEPTPLQAIVPIAPPAPAEAREPIETPPVGPEKPDETPVTTEESERPALRRPAAARPSRSRITAAQILASRGAEIAQVTAQLDQKAEAYAQRERRRAISASTREYKYAAYLDAWRRKVERIGNLNYPDEAKRRKLYGNLVLQVAIRADGSVEHIRVVHSSGFSVLDDAAVRIVELGAPYAPFPADIRAETDVLDITRTWQFLSSNRLGWEK